MSVSHIPPHPGSPPPGPTDPAKRARKKTTAKNSKNRPSTTPPADTGSNSKRAPKRAQAKFAKKRYSTDDLFNTSRWKKQIERCNKLIYGPALKAEKWLKKQKERDRAEARFLNRKWRLEAIDAEFDHICNQINAFVRLVMGSYGYHYHRGAWRRRRGADYNQRYLEDNRRDTDPVSYYMLDWVDPAKAPPPPPDPHHFAPLSKFLLWDPNNQVDNAPTTAHVAQPVRLRPNSSPEPSAVPEGSTFSQPTATDFGGCAAAPLPQPSKLPFARPFDPLFPRAMDGTTFLVPRPDPLEPPEPEPPPPPKRRRKPSERQVRKLYEDFLLNDDPVPDENATRYTDSRVFLAELTPNCWRRYGEYFYDFFKRRIPERAPKSPPKARAAPSEDNQSDLSDASRG